MNGYVVAFHGLLAVVVVVGLSVGADRSGPVQVPTADAKKASARFVNVSGGTYDLMGPDGCKAVVLIFFGHDCPISNGYAPEIVRLSREFSPKGIAFRVVYADAELGVEDARKHAKEYGLTCPAVLDPEMILARGVGATVKPEVAVLSPKGDLLYRGRIDDLYADFGKRRTRPTSRELKDALETVLAGKPMTVTRTEAIGCDIDFPDDKK